MENTLVSSRIPRAKKEAGVAVLDSLGATTSDLINSAFDYLIEHRALPAAQKAARKKSGLAQFLSETTLAIDWGDETRSYKDVMRARRAEDYERLA